MSLSQTPLLRQLYIHPRLVISALIGLAVVLLMPQQLGLHDITRLIIGWNVGACLYLVLAGVMMVRSTKAQIKRRADMQDEGQWVILTLVIVAMLACLSAIVAELAVVKDMKGAVKYAHIGLTVLTIVSSWAFTHVMFALHYAHEFYAERSDGQKGGLDFPGDAEPDYGDFLYFAFLIGTSGATADVPTTSKSMRRIGLVHCVLAFAFNTTLLALTINIAASLF